MAVEGRPSKQKLLSAADRRSPSGAGVFAVFQAGDGASRKGQRAVRVQRQDQRDGNGARSQEIKTGLHTLVTVEL